MAHLSENCKRLLIYYFEISSNDQLLDAVRGFNDVCVLRLPPCQTGNYSSRLQNIGALVNRIAEGLGSEATLVTIGEVIDLVQVHATISASMRYQLWIAIKRSTPLAAASNGLLPTYHFGALVHTKYKTSLRHTKTRISYTYCPACDKTTKDYGGKKHTYHEYGTLLSDIWRDISCELNGNIEPSLDILADLFGVDPYRELRVFDLRPLGLTRSPVVPSVHFMEQAENPLPSSLVNQVLYGDCLEQLAQLPDNSIDFVFVDPPYNLGKNYLGYGDDLQIKEYFNWCDIWLSQLARVLKPGRTLALLNIPLWSIRHFLYLETILNFQNWLVWDALSFPVRLIMPSHYAILCFSKGAPRTLPGLIGESGLAELPVQFKRLRILEPLAEGFCLRDQCKRKRHLYRIDDQGPLTDLWWDIHRLKHNSRRVNHPTQLPPMLLYRMISLFTQPNEMVFDCFNGSGTTTLAAHQIRRNFIGIEKSNVYYELTLLRHEEIRMGLDPFRKAERVLTAKNSRVPRMPKQKYKVPKKTLQLEVRRVARELGRLPTRDEMARVGRYPIEYYDEYFASWGEACAAARNNGMSETKQAVMLHSKSKQLQLFDS